MAVLRRIVSGSAATAFEMGATLGAQLFLVPVFLAHWDAASYGAWLTIQAAAAVMTLPDIAHQDFVGFECLKLPISDRASRSRLLWAALPIVVCTSFALLLLLIILSSLWGAGLGIDGDLVTSVKTGLIIVALYWLFFSPLGLFGRILTSLQRYSRTAWWSASNTAIGAMASAAGVVSGYQIEGTITIQMLAQSALACFMYLDYTRLLRSEKIEVMKPDIRLGIRNFKKSLALSAANGIELLQQAGYRLVLLPGLGPAGIASFSTMRTVANVAQQSASALVYATTPELTRFMSEKDAERTSSLICCLWLVIVFLTAPVIVLIQILAPYVFSLWTQGKIPFDPQAFAVLSIVVMLASLTQPCRLIVRANNLVRTQLLIAIFTAAVLVTSTMILVPVNGVLGAAVAVLLSELARDISLIGVARRWLKTQNLTWPLRPFVPSCAIVVTTSALLLSLSGDTSKFAGLTIFVVIYCVTAAWFWRELPKILRLKIMSFAVAVARRERLAS